MAFQLNPLSFLGASGQVPQYQGLADIFKNYNAAKESGLNQEQMQLQNALQHALNPGAVRQQQEQLRGQEQQNRQREELHPEVLKKQQLENALNEILNPGKAQLQEAQTKLTNAQALNAPYSSLQGPAAVANSVSRLEQMYGPNDERVKLAKKLLDIQIRNDESSIRARDINTDIAPIRVLSPEVKSMYERDVINQGIDPRTKKPLSERDKELRLNQLDLAQAKRITNPVAQTKAFLAINMEKTIDSFQPEDLVRYSGPMGAINKKIENGLALSSNESKDYQKYRQALKAAETLRSQVRQFYGDSISPQSIQHLDDLTNPEHWASNPKLALLEYKQFVNILKSEADTYRNALYTTEGLIPEEGRYQSGGMPFNEAINTASKHAGGKFEDPLGIR